MLTKDIGLSDCVLDLVDNSIHSLITKTNLDVSEHLLAGTKAKKINALIDIAFTPSKVSVQDDAGGSRSTTQQSKYFSSESRWKIGRIPAWVSLGSV